MYSGLAKLAYVGDEGGVRRMLAEGTPVDEVDNGRFNATPLMVAARAGHLEVVQLLLEAGANINHLDLDLFSPVTTSAAAKQWKVVKLLAERGGDFRLADSTGHDGFAYLRRCRGNRTRAEIEAILAARAPRPSAEPEPG